MLSVAVASAAQKTSTDRDWYQWRGPNSDGHSLCTGTPGSIPEGGPKLLWKIDTLGEGYSNLSFSGNQIFTMGDADGKCYVIALDRKTGKESWRTSIGKSGGNYSGPRCTPACDGQTVYAMGQFGDFVAIDAKSGKGIWHVNVEKEFGGKVMSGWNFSMSPILDGKQIVIPIGGDGGTLAAFDKKGKLLWRSTELRDSAAYTSAVPVEINGERQFLVLTEKSIAGISPRGKLLWRSDFPGKVAVCSDPVCVGDTVFAACGYGIGACGYKISGKGTNWKAEKLYEDKKLESHHGGIIVVGDHVYFLTNSQKLVCVDPKTGKVVWENKSVGKGAIGCVDGKLLLRSEKGEGTVALAAASPDGYKEFGRFDQPNRSDKNSWTYPLVVDNCLYLRDQGVLLCYEF